MATICSDALQVSADASADQAVSVVLGNDLAIRGVPGRPPDLPDLRVDAREISARAYVTFEHGQKVRTLLQRPQLSVQKITHQHALENQPIACKLIVENTGTTTVEDMSIELTAKIEPQKRAEIVAGFLGRKLLIMQSGKPNPLVSGGARPVRP